jgi:hypothetical protein
MEITGRPANTDRTGAERMAGNGTKNESTLLKWSALVSGLLRRRKARGERIGFWGTYPIEGESNVPKVWKQWFYTGPTVAIDRVEVNKAPDRKSAEDERWKCVAIQTHGKSIVTNPERPPNPKETDLLQFAVRRNKSNKLALNRLQLLT